MNDQESMAATGGRAARRLSLGAAAADWLFTSNGSDHAFDSLGRASARRAGRDDKPSASALGGGR